MEDLKGLEKILEKEVKNNKILLVSLKSKDYRKGMENLMEFSLKLFKKTCYVTLNDPSATIVGKLGETEKTKIFFIDCVASTVKTPQQEKNVIFVSSPRALTEISIAMKKVIETGGVESVMFDSISAMLVYEQPPNVIKFVHNQVLTCREAELVSLFVILREDVGEELMKDLTMFVDKIVEVGR